MKQSRFATARCFSFRKVGRVATTLLFVGLIFVSRAYQPSSRVCKVVNANRYQRSVSLKVQAESTAALESSITLFSDDVSDEINIKSNSIEAVSSSPIFERVQRGLARLTEIIPKPIRLAVVAVASSLLLFELSKTLLFLAVPIIAVLGEHLALCRLMN
jgi:enoyl-[acyl-carrier-protein] reductase (NADH)